MGTTETDRTKRQELRRRLRAAGLPEDEVTARVLELQARRDRAKNDPTITPELRAKIELIEAQRAGILRAKTRKLYDAQPEQPDDTSYRPRSVDSTLKGAGRATGDTAKSIQRGRALTKWEVDDA